MFFPFQQNPTRFSGKTLNDSKTEAISVKNDFDFSFVLRYLKETERNRFLFERFAVGTESYDKIYVYMS